MKRDRALNYDPIQLSKQMVRKSINSKSVPYLFLVLCNWKSWSFYRDCKYHTEWIEHPQITYCHMKIKKPRVHIFSIRCIFYDKMDLKLFYFHVTMYIKSQIQTQVKNLTSLLSSKLKVTDLDFVKLYLQNFSLP